MEWDLGRITRLRLIVLCSLSSFFFFDFDFECFISTLASSFSASLSPTNQSTTTDTTTTTTNTIIRLVMLKIMYYKYPLSFFLSYISSINKKLYSLFPSSVGYFFFLALLIS